MSRSRLFGFAAAAGCLAAGLAPANLAAQPVQRFDVPVQIGRAIAIDQAAPAGPVTPDETTPDESEADLGPIEATQPATPIGPNEIRLQLLDGSILTGKLSIAELVVATDFGPLTVPISRIRSIRPGLQSYPELKARLDGLVADLAADSFEAREGAQKELVGYGLKIRNYLATVPDDGDQERQTRLQTVRKALEEAEMMAGDDVDAEFAWIEGDTVVTDRFTVVGKIESTEFQMSNRYGELTVALGDVEMGTREWGSRGSVSRRMKIDAANFVQRQWAASGIRVERGDKITVVATGTMSLVPWGEQSSPDGVPHCGTYMGAHPVGSVIAKIGEGKLIAVGAEETFTAPQSGVLQFGISMMDNFANQGYDWQGGYELRIRVEPK